MDFLRMGRTSSSTGQVRSANGVESYQNLRRDCVDLLTSYSIKFISRKITIRSYTKERKKDEQENCKKGYCTNSQNGRD